MKNLHLLPTNKKTRLVIPKYSETLLLTDMPSNSALYKKFHIYITNSEDIKDGYVLNTFNNTVYKIVPDNSSREILSNPTILPLCAINREHYFKIILTNDTELIKDKVQAIPDEFLEWFCKNPSCESVEVDSWLGGLSLLGLVRKYKIIIPKEEVKQYPIGGYAPGFYSCTCLTCKTQFQGDKRACQCEPCAIEMTKEEPKQIKCYDKFNQILSDGDYVDVQKAGVYQIYKKDDGQLYFNPYGKEDMVSAYFSNDIVKCDVKDNWITNDQYENNEEEHKQESCEYIKEVGCIKDICTCNTGPKQEPLEETNQTTAIRFLEWYRRKGVIYQFHAYHIQGSDDNIYLNADQLFEIFKKENYEK